MCVSEEQKVGGPQWFICPGESSVSLVSIVASLKLSSRATRSEMRRTIASILRSDCLPLFLQGRALQLSIASVKVESCHRQHTRCMLAQQASLTIVHALSGL